jgi:hypothetical protein
MTMISEKGNQDERRAKADLNITMTAPSGDSVLPDEKVQLSETPDTLESSLKLSNVLGGINNELAKSSALEDELDKQNAIDKIKIDGAVEEIAIKLENMKNNMAVDLVKNDTHENFVMAYAQKEQELKTKGSLNRTEELRKFVDDYKNTWTTDAIDLTEYGRNYINDAIDSSAVGMEASSYASELKDMLDAHKKKFQSDASQLAIKVGRGDVTFDNAFLTATATMADLNKK